MLSSYGQLLSFTLQVSSYTGFGSNSYFPVYSYRKSGRTGTLYSAPDFLQDKCIVNRARARGDLPIYSSKQRGDLLIMQYVTTMLCNDNNYDMYGLTRIAIGVALKEKKIANYVIHVHNE